MSTLTTHVKVLGFSPGLNGSAAAEATTVDTGPNQARDVFNAGPDPLHIHPVTLRDEGHRLGTPVSVEVGDRAVIIGLSKLSSPGEANITLSGTRPA